MERSIPQIWYLYSEVAVVQSLSCVWLRNHMNCSTPGFPVLHYVRVCSNSCALSQWYHLTILSSITPFTSCPRSFPASRSFSMSQPIASGGQKVLEHQYFQWLSGLISFRIDYFDLLDIQGTLKSLLQHHNLKASIFLPSAFFMVQLSHLLTTAGKITALTTQG